LLACLAVFACAIADASVDHNAIAAPNLRYSFADSVDHSGAVGAEDPGRSDCDSRQARHREHIEMVHCGGHHANAHFARPRPGLGYVLPEFDFVYPAVRGDGECSQRLP
jgi:hypothetical protein